MPETLTINLTKDTAWALGTFELPTIKKDELAPRLEPGNIQCDRKGHDALEDIYLGDDTKVSAEPESARIPDIKRGEANGFDNRNAMKYKPREKDRHRESSLILRMITNGKDDEEVKNTKVLEFTPVRKPEEAKIGEIIHFMHNPRDDSSD